MVLAGCQRKLWFGLCASIQLHCRGRQWYFACACLAVGPSVPCSCHLRGFRGNLGKFAGEWPVGNRDRKVRVPVPGQGWPGASPTACPPLPDGGAGCRLHDLWAPDGGATPSHCPWFFVSVFLWGRWSTLGLASVMHNDPFFSLGILASLIRGHQDLEVWGDGTQPAAVTRYQLLCVLSNVDLHCPVWIPWPDFLERCQTAICQTNPSAAADCLPYVPCSRDEQGLWKECTGLVASSTDCEDNQLC